MVAGIVMFVVLVLWAVIGAVIMASSPPAPAASTRAGCEERATGCLVELAGWVGEIR